MDPAHKDKRQSVAPKRLIDATEGPQHGPGHRQTGKPSQAYGLMHCVPVALP